MKFIDEVGIRVVGGAGGDGVVRWHREKYVPKGGPDGGNGGSGGAVIFVCDPGLNTLIDFAHNPLLRAQPGDPGQERNKEGRAGRDLIRKVPVGTQVFYRDQLVADLKTPGARWVAARGGVGGKGNAFFKSSTNQAPKMAQKGQPGDDLELKLILKSVADVGLVGFPNVGKSTLISKISAAHPKIADYPFTTLKPSLGVVLLDEERRFVVADIPGLISGAHEGKGLGIQFLKHIERTSVLAHLVDPALNYDQEQDTAVLAQRCIEQLTAIEHELGSFSEDLLNLPRAIVVSKADLPVAEEVFAAMRPEFEKRGLPAILVSSFSERGLAELKELLYSLVVNSGSTQRSE